MMNLNINFLNKNATLEQTEGFMTAGPMSRFSTSQNEKILPILTCQKLSLSVYSFIHSFEFVWRHIVAMAMNSFRIVESFQIFKNQGENHENYGN